MDSLPLVGGVFTFSEAEAIAAHAREALDCGSRCLMRLIRTETEA